MIDLLIIYPCETYKIKSLDLVDSYDVMQSFFVEQNIKKYYKNKNIVTIGLNIWRPKKEKSRFSFSFFQNCLQDQYLDIKDVKHILFTKLGPERQFKKNFIKDLLDTISGNIYKFEDTNKNVYNRDRFYTVGHFTKQGPTNNYIDCGLSVATDLFYPAKIKSNEEFVVHVDHNYPNIANYFEDIKQFLFLLENKISKNSQWKRLKIIYHDRETPINEIGHYDFESIKITDLASIYQHCHLGIISHRESLGQYPLEMLSCGTSVLSMNKADLLTPVKKQLPLLDYDTLNIDNLLDPIWLESKCRYNRNYMLKYDYSLFVKKFIDYILFSKP